MLASKRMEMDLWDITLFQNRNFTANFKSIPEGEDL